MSTAVCGPVPNPAAFERANYIKTLASHSAQGIRR
jgi:hypothetical protein